MNPPLLLLPQRYVFSSKSQQYATDEEGVAVVVATTKVRIFKQITTVGNQVLLTFGLLLLPQRYVFSSKSQHSVCVLIIVVVVVATTKVRIFKQITTLSNYAHNPYSCCCYHKGTYFQANHNWKR